MPQLEVLVLEGAAVDGLAAGAVVVREVAALRRKSIFIFYLREMELGQGFSSFLRRFFWVAVAFPSREMTLAMVSRQSCFFFPLFRDTVFLPLFPASASNFN